MTSLLQWRFADKDDHPLRRAFTCADPPKRRWSRARGSFHPREWELEVQSFIRGPRSILTDEYLLLGFDGRVLATVVWWTEDGGGPEDILLMALAVDVSYRGKKPQGHCGPVALEALSESVDCMKRRAKAAGAESIIIEARIDSRNAPSKRLFAKCGFRFIQTMTTDERYESWAYHDVS